MATDGDYTEITDSAGEEDIEVTLHQPILHRSETDTLLPQLISTTSADVGRDFYKGICDKLLECAEDNSGLDVYQITAFYKYYHADEDHSTYKYIYYSFKSILCCMIQTVGMIAFLYNILMTMPENVSVCTLNKSWDLKLLATLFSLYIAAQYFSILKVRRNDGLYEHIAYAPSFIGKEWLYLGLYSNMFAVITSVYGSFLIIYSSQTSVDMVLNSVALYFIIDLDTFMVDHFDYSRVKGFMKREFKFEDWYDADWYDDDAGDVQFTHLFFGKITLQISGKEGKFGKCGIITAYIGGVTMICASIIGFIGAILAPVAIAFCY